MIISAKKSQEITPPKVLILIKGKEENNLTRSIKLKGNHINFRIFLDVSSVEIFINDGEFTLTSNVYCGDLDEMVEFYSIEGKSKFNNIVKYDIEVI